ncbi:ArsR/SmtB family transcription factor [Sphingosinicella rhizophila]|uniref:Metalloregulator ArsR/SmtB family transcription factor n=1 Tax=Sphingosinicella rhizophila TaxID=3050082 RepID=A0ABU3Q870_9SPHN|nr:metalloregulator ArsR/SmtB family transcription factor [Sphingosinicella sp. GR2756]MDT9599125.1 metalloregulator ArsR/SmtB family transcription factor [Sphingosinicella sp. GR2756]
MEDLLQQGFVIQFSRHAAEAAGLLKALASEPRLLVLCHLAEAGEMSAGDLTERVGLSQSALSQHLARLREEGLVATRKDAQTVFYRVCDPKAEQLLALLHDLFCPELGQESATGTKGT